MVGIEEVEAVHVDRKAADAFFPLVNSGQATVIEPNAFFGRQGPFFREHEVADIPDEAAHDIAEDEAVAEMGGQFS